MATKRRDFVKAMALGAMLPGQTFEHFLNETSFSESLNSMDTTEGIEEVYKKAIVVDGLIITRDWDEESQPQHSEKHHRRGRAASL